MYQPPLCYTSHAVSRIVGGGQRETPINVARGQVCLCLNTRYDAMRVPNDIWDLKHYSKTAILIEYE